MNKSFLSIIACSAIFLLNSPGANATTGYQLADFMISHMTKATKHTKKDTVTPDFITLANSSFISKVINYLELKEISTCTSKIPKNTIPLNIQPDKKQHLQYTAFCPKKAGCSKAIIMNFTYAPDKNSKKNTITLPSLYSYWNESHILTSCYFFPEE